MAYLCKRKPVNKSQFDSLHQASYTMRVLNPIIEAVDFLHPWRNRSREVGGIKGPSDNNSMLACDMVRVWEQR